MFNSKHEVLWSICMQLRFSFFSRQKRIKWHTKNEGKIYPLLTHVGVNWTLPWEATTHVWPTAGVAAKEYIKKQMLKKGVVVYVCVLCLSSPLPTFYLFKKRRKIRNKPPHHKTTTSSTCTTSKQRQVCLFVDQILSDQGTGFWEITFQFLFLV